MSPRNATISSENRGPILNLATWITLCAAILAAGIKVYTKKIMRSAVDLNDLFIVLAVVGRIAGSVVADRTELEAGCCDCSMCCCERTSALWTGSAHG